MAVYVLSHSLYNLRLILTSLFQWDFSGVTFKAIYHVKQISNAAHLSNSETAQKNNRLTRQQPQARLCYTLDLRKLSIVYGILETQSL